MKRVNLNRYAWLSICAAILTISLKLAAYFLTGSVGMLSDALESVINLVAAFIALLMLRVAAQPPDEEHAFGHDKAEYFSSGIEGALIFVAALSIAYAAISRFLAPAPLEQVGWGLAVSTIATIINLVVGRILIRAGHTYSSITLEADGHHLMTDVWTSAGVFIGVVIVYLTGWIILDPVIALLVAANILWTGYTLVRRSALGLMDTAISPGDFDEVRAILDRYVSERGIDYHALRTRQAGIRKFVYVHLLVPDEWTVQRGHELSEKIENEIRETVSNSVVFTHLEPLEDPSSWEDVDLIR